MKSKNFKVVDIEKQVPPSSNILTLRATKVSVKNLGSKEVQDLIDSMYSTAYGRQRDADFPTVVGLAAPQIGVSKRIVLIGIDATGQGEQPRLQEFINPKIVDSSKELEEGREGCFSTGSVCGIVNRAKSVKLAAKDRTGKDISYTLQGFPARVAQHEIDHLDGIRFPDRITDDSKLHWVDSDEFGRYRKEWKDWAKLCSRETWENIKIGE